MIQVLGDNIDNGVIQEPGELAQAEEIIKEAEKELKSDIDYINLAGGASSCRYCIEPVKDNYEKIRKMRGGRYLKQPYIKLYGENPPFKFGRYTCGTCFNKLYNDGNKLNMKKK